MTETPVRRRAPSRRSFIQAAGLAAVAPAAFAQTPHAQTATPPSVITNPPRQWGRRAAPDIYPDPDIIIIDPSFKQYLLGITAIHRIATGFLWAKVRRGRARASTSCSATCRATRSTVACGTIGRVTPFRKPSNNSNGNSFDFQGRQLSTEDFFRRVIRWEHDGTMTVIADQFDGKPLNSPNDLVPHPDGSIWFTDPPYGDTLSEGHPDDAGGPTNPQGLLNPRIGAAERRRDRRHRSGSCRTRCIAGTRAAGWIR